MKKPLQAILVAPEWHKMVENGQKKFTVREGIRDYELGKAVLCCDKVSWYKGIEIKTVRYEKMEDVPEDVVKNKGFTSKEELFKKLQQYYPNIQWDSVVTIIGW